MLSYDRSAAASGGLRMSEAAETAGDRPQPKIFQVKSFSTTKRLLEIHILKSY